jgi:hypothetical protein
MGAASYLQYDFLGGEISKSAQGRIDHPKYRTWMNACLNWIPVQDGTLVRRPGSHFAGTTRGGAAGRGIRFDFNQAMPYVMEFTDAYLRFWSGGALVMNNDQQVVTAISAANPAVVTVSGSLPTAWATGIRVSFNGLGTNNPLLQNRVFIATKTGASTFSLADGITGNNIDGSTLGAFVSGNVTRVLEIQTVYSGGTWQNMRAVLCDQPIPNGVTAGAVLLHQQIQPYLLTVTGLPTPTTFATFSLAPINFKDGPYFDPIPNNGTAQAVTLTPSGVSGLINLTITFPAWDATIAYSKDDFVASGATNYQSLRDQNLNLTPASNPAAWAVVSSGVAIGPNGFQGTDVGRLIRLYSEPPLWSATTAYVVGNEVSYPSGLNGAYTYWRCITNNTGSVPGTNVSNWAVDPAGALWSWGKITALVNLINPSLAGSVNIGTLTQNAGLAAAFDSNTNKASTACAANNSGAASGISDQYIGKNYSGATAQAIASATLFPSSDLGFGQGTYFNNGAGVFLPVSPIITINLRGKASAPASPSDGTLLGTSGALSIINAPVSITSNNAVTTYNYVWFEIIADISRILGGGNFVQANNIYVAQAQFFSPVAGGAGNAVQFQVLGSKLLYTTPVRVWRLGLFSNTTGFPTAGVYHEGRVWFTGVVDNRIDSSKSNGILINGSIDMAPTNPDGSVSDNNGISYLFNAPDVNPIFWMAPDQLGIVCGTQAGEWLVQASNNNNPLSPTNIQAHRVSSNRCANIEPRRGPMTLLVVQAYRRTILEYFADVFSGKFAAKSANTNAQHLSHALISEMAFQRELSPIMWARCADGSLIGDSYRRESLVSSQDPEFNGWHRHTLGSGRIVESICTGSNVTGTADTLFMVTNVGGIRHVEYLHDLFQENDDPTRAWLQDDAVLPTSTVVMPPVISIPPQPTDTPYGSLTINGLWHLNGSTVTVSAGGLDCGDYLVTSGSVNVPFGDGVSGGTASGQFTQQFVMTNPQIVVGFTYTSDAQLLRPILPVDSGARAGPALGKKRRTQRFAVAGVSMAGMSIGTVFTKLYPVLFKSDANVIMPVGQTFTGIYRDQLNDDYSYDSMLCWRITRPYTAIISAIEGFIHTQDE